MGTKSPLNSRFCGKTTPTCSQGSINESELESQLKAELVKLEISPNFRNWALGVLKRQNATESADRENVMRSQRKEYDSILAKIDNLIDMRAGNEINEEEYRRKKAVLTAEKSRVYALLEGTDKRVDNWLEVAERGFNYQRISTYERKYLPHLVRTTS